MNRGVSVLAVLPDLEDRTLLHSILSHSNWTLELVQTYRDAERAVRDPSFGVVITESALTEGYCWKDLLRVAAVLPVPPPIVVTDWLGDEQLWTEVLELGGYDLLTKPFDASEVYRIVSLGWLFWRRQCSQLLLRKPPKRIETAARNVLHSKLAAAS